jgi:hypothetical protein
MVAPFIDDIHTKHINTAVGQNVEFVNVKLVVHIVTAELYRFISLLLTDDVELLSLSVSVCLSPLLLFCLCQYEEDLAFGDRTAPNLLIFSYTGNSFSLYHGKKKGKRLAFFGEKLLVSV